MANQNKKLSELMWTYEGNTPHNLVKAFTEGGSLCCEYCGACINDHVPYDHNISVTYYEYVALLKCTFKTNGKMTTPNNLGTLILIDEELAY